MANFTLKEKRFILMKLGLFISFYLYIISKINNLKIYMLIVRASP